MTNLSSILKSRGNTLPTKVHLVKAMVFPVVMYGCESWTGKKAEPRRIDAFELWYWRRLLRVTWTARRSNQSILKEISPGCSLEELMLKLKLQYFWPPHAKNWLIGKDPDAGRDWGQEKGMTGWDGWMASPTRWTWVWVNSGSWWWTGRPGMLQFMGSQRVGQDRVTELNWRQQESMCHRAFTRCMEKSQKQRALQYNPLMRKRVISVIIMQISTKWEETIPPHPVQTHRNRHILQSMFIISIHNSFSRTTIYGITECLINCHGIPFKIPLIKKHMLQQYKDSTENS